jgi:hypothetical protein
VSVVRKEESMIFGSSRFCVISLTYIGSIDLCVLCVFVVRSTPSLGEMYLRIHFTHQSWESRFSTVEDACYVDDEQVTPQEGDFYAGWITSDIVGPFKGGPGTRGW